jgi:hypothetical protein
LKKNNRCRYITEDTICNNNTFSSPIWPATGSKRSTQINFKSSHGSACVCYFSTKDDLAEQVLNFSMSYEADTINLCNRICSININEEVAFNIYRRAARIQFIPPLHILFIYFRWAPPKTLVRCYFSKKRARMCHLCCFRIVFISCSVFLIWVIVPFSLVNLFKFLCVIRAGFFLRTENGFFFIFSHCVPFFRKLNKWLWCVYPPYAKRKYVFLYYIGSLWRTVIAACIH